MTQEPIAEVERCYLSACLIDDGALDFYLRSQIGPEAFTDEFHQLVVGKMVAFREAGRAFDIASLARELSACGEMNRLDMLASLAWLVETTAYAKTHWGQILDSWRMRNFKAQALKLSTLAGGEKWEDVEGKVREAAQTLLDTRHVEARRSQMEVAQAAIDDSQRIIDGKPVLNSVPITTGIYCIDRYCRPLDVATGDFNCILFAKTSVGKSSLMAGIVGHNVLGGKRVVVFLGETSHDGLLRQMAGQIARCSIDPYELSRETYDAQRRYMETLERLKGYHDGRLTVYDDDFYIEDVVARSKAVAKEFGSVDLVVIDHLHCLKARKPFPANAERIRFNYMSGELKPLGKELGCPVLTLAQPNRMFKTENRPPNRSDLKETGNLEDDADRILALHLPREDSNGVEQNEYSDCPEIICHQLKFRRGRTCSVVLRFDKAHTRFYDPDEEGRTYGP